MRRRPLPQDYAKRVYAGVLGKTIGVYLGRPIEGWSHEAIVDRFDEIEGYVHEALGMPLVVADDDLSGTFTFLRAMEDAVFPSELRAEEIAEAWLNYLIEGRTVLWWGGMGNSTEHTAYLRLKKGYRPPESGSISLNGPLVAQQIGAQIFIDGWGLVYPGDPERAADLARRAAIVSHDGEAVVAAQVVAAMVAASFTARDLDAVLDAGLAQAPEESLIAEMGRAIRTERELDWHDALRRIQRDYGYDRYGGGCHVVPNHALILLALVYGRGDFDRSLSIVNTAGWDTDCNSANVGCILGVLNGLAGIAPRWREPFADRLLLPTADGGRCVTDCAREALAIVRIAEGMRGVPSFERGALSEGVRFQSSVLSAQRSTLNASHPPRFFFPFEGSVQGFTSERAVVSHVGGRLRIAANGPAIATTPTFLSPEELQAGGYGLMASPTLYPGQTLRARIAAVGAPLRASLVLRVYGADDALLDRSGPTSFLYPGPSKAVEWRVPDFDGRPIAAVGFRLEGAGTLDVDELDWSGEPETILGPTEGGAVWRRAWVNGMSDLTPTRDGLRAIQNEGTGLAFHGAQEWRDVAFSARVAPNLAASFGLAVRVQGMRRYVAAVLEDGFLRLVRAAEGERETLAECPLEWPVGEARDLKVAVKGARFFVRCGEASLQADDGLLTYGAVAIVLTEGRLDVGDPRVRPS